jgi:hypothetical protein
MIERSEEPMPHNTSSPPPAVTHPPGPLNSDSVDSPDRSHVDLVMERIEDELRCLTLERVAIGARLRRIKRTLIGLANIFGPDIINEELRDLIFRAPYARATPLPDQRGFTNICRQILRDESQPLTLLQVCERMREVYPSVLARHRHPTTSLAVVLRRLQHAGDAEILNSNEVRTWQWTGSQDDPKRFQRTRKCKDK